MKTVISSSFVPPAPRFGIALPGFATASISQLETLRLQAQLNEHRTVMEIMGYLILDEDFPERDRILPVLARIVRDKDFPNQRNIFQNLIRIFKERNTQNAQSQAILDLLDEYIREPVLTFGSQANYWVG